MEDTMPLANYRSWQRSFQRYLRHGRRYVSPQLLGLTTVAFRVTTILSTVGVAIPDWNFKSYLNIEDAMLPINCLSWQPKVQEVPKKIEEGILLVNYLRWQPWLSELLLKREILVACSLVLNFRCSKFLLWVA